MIRNHLLTGLAVIVFNSALCRGDETFSYLESEQHQLTLKAAAEPQPCPSKVGGAGELLNQRSKEFTFSTDDLRTKDLSLQIKPDTFELQIFKGEESWSLSLCKAPVDQWSLARDEYGLTVSGVAEGLGACSLSVQVVKHDVLRLVWLTEKSASTSLHVSGLDGPCFGGGEVFRSVDLRDSTWVMRPLDSVRKKSEQGITYCPVSWFFTPEGLGLFVDSASIENFSFTKTDNKNESQLLAPVSDKGFTFWLFGGESPKKLLQNFTGVTGRPPTAPEWAYGVWVNVNNGRTNVEDTLRFIREYRVPVSALWIFDCKEPYDVDYYGWHEWSKGKYGDIPSLTDAIKDHGIRPMTYLQTRCWSKGFSQKNALQEWKSFQENVLVRDGWDGYMEDFGDAQYTDDPLMTIQYHKATHMIAKEMNPGKVSFCRSGFAGSAPFTQILWGGDQTQDWGPDGYPSLLPAALSAGMSGFGVWAPDVLECSSLELYKRWVQFGAFTCVMREHQWRFEPDRYHLFSSEQTLKTFRHYARQHNALVPYIRSMVNIASQTGIPVIRHMALDYPEDITCWDSDEQYMFGDRMLVAPVLKENARSKEVYFPEGDWVDFWSTERIQGGGKLIVDAPVDVIPVFQKAGTVLPLYPDTIDTLAEDLAGECYETAGNRLILRVSPAFDQSLDDTLSLFDGTTVMTRQDSGTLTMKITKSPVERRYEIQLPGPTAIAQITVQDGKVIAAPECGVGHTSRLFVLGKNPTVQCAVKPDAPSRKED